MMTALNRRPAPYWNREATVSFIITHVMGSTFYRGRLTDMNLSLAGLSHSPRPKLASSN